MTLIYRDLTLHRYNEMLKAGCDSFDADYYANYFSEIGNIDTPGITKDEFLLRLRSVEDKIGEGKNLGEIKCYVLLQWLNLKYGNQLYYFCSDDKDARNGVLGIEDINVRCITLVSALLRIHMEMNYSFADMEPYIQAMLGYFSAHDRKTIRVVEASSTGRYEKVDCKQVLEEIFEGKYIELPNGFLKYKTVE